MRILILSPPFYGHLNVLQYLKKLIERQHNKCLIKFLVLGWRNVQIEGYENICTDDLTTSDPMVFTFPRVISLMDGLIDMVKSFDPTVIIYDFFCIEGYILSKLMGSTKKILSICSIPAMIGRNTFDYVVSEQNKNIIQTIETKYGVMVSPIEQISDGFFVPMISSAIKHTNIVWSYEKIVKCCDYLVNRNLTKKDFCFVGTRISDKKCPTYCDAVDFANNNILNGRKNIYISFGTVVTNNLWNNQPSVRSFLRKIFKWLIRILANSEPNCGSTYGVIVSLDRDIFPVWPDNFRVYRHVDQLRLLEKCHIFMTHCGGNSFNESISMGVPMIGIPFFGDQHLIASLINRLDIGVQFESDRPKYTNTNCPYERNSLNYKTLCDAFNTLSVRHADYLANINRITNNAIQYSHFDRITVRPNNHMYNRSVVSWSEGDLLYGTNVDRARFIELLDQSDLFRINQFAPFSELFDDSDKIDILPRIIDIYNDSFLDYSLYQKERQSKFTKYNIMLVKFRQWLVEKQILIDSRSMDCLICRICTVGIDFFVKNGHTIHFILDRYDCRINRITGLELNHIFNNWTNLRDNIKFYRINHKYDILRVL